MQVRSISYLLCVFTLLVAPTLGQSFVQGPIFESNSAWQAKLPDDAPIRANSSLYVGNIISQIQKYGPWINTLSYSVPIYIAPQNQPNITVTLDKESGSPIVDQLKAAFANVPLPLEVHPANGSDHHLVIWQPSTNRMWEFWVMRNEANETHPAPNWHCDWGGYLEGVTKSPGFFTQPFPDWGATATSLMLMGGLILLSEAKAGVIPHALAFATLDMAPWNVVVLPAQRSDGNGNGIIPEGTRFRLPPDVNLTGIKNPFSKIMAEAIRDYGLIVRDTAGVPVTYAEDPTPYGLLSNPWPAIFGDWENHVMEQIPWSEMQIVDPVWTPWDPSSPWYQPPN